MEPQPSYSPCLERRRGLWSPVAARSCCNSPAGSPSWPEGSIRAHSSCSSPLIPFSSSQFWADVWLRLGRPPSQSCEGTIEVPVYHHDFQHSLPSSKGCPCHPLMPPSHWSFLPDFLICRLQIPTPDTESVTSYKLWPAFTVTCGQILAFLMEYW